ncbi:ComF family protein [Candidatus Daviesbacteria bacterium]|nr:ComF family protein [Candidatus Daviesbacteria bacterium]
MTNWILDILFPKKCIGCKKEGSYYCQSCISNILQADLVCPRCEGLAVGGQTHPICRKKFGLDGLWSLGVYAGPLKTAIQKLKYEPSLVKDFAPVLMDITIEYWAKYQPFILDLIKKDQGRGWVVVPVPLHWFKENKRGFNQSALIGQLLSNNLGLSYCEALKRTRYTKSQVGLKEKDRKGNIKNAFTLNTTHPSFGGKYLIHNTNVLLIDDVWTTGSTLRECCYFLKRAGAKKVWAITLAR